MMNKLLVLVVAIFMIACQHQNQTEKYKLEVLQAEAEFASMATAEGVETAFLHFAAEDAVMNRNNEIVKGKDEIRAYFARQKLSNVKLEWEPDFVDVSSSGDLAYTYGKFNFSATDPDGKNIEASGIFHTVWKRQKDGSWKFVYD